MYWIPVSAKTGEALKDKLHDLAHWLGGEGAGHSLGDIAFTMLVGRSHFSVRAAILAHDVADLERKIQSVLQTGADHSYLYGEVQKGAAKDAASKEIGERLIDELLAVDRLETADAEQKLRTLAELYTKGLALDWKRLYQGSDCRRISLPTYPFAKESYRISGNAPHPSSITMCGAPVVSSALHPLVDRNESTLGEEKFTKNLLADEFFIKDHLVAGGAILPGVAYLEIARFTGELAAEKPVRVIKDVMWARPVVVGGPSKEVHIGLFPEGGTIAYEVYSTEEGARVVHSRGKIQAGDIESGSQTKYDLEAIKQRCTVRTLKNDYYQKFRDVGIDYGATFQVTEEALGGSGEALLTLSLPQELRDEASRYHLHPSLMDGAFRAALTAGSATGTIDGLRVPFALGQMEIYKPLEPTCYAYAEVTSENRGAQSDIMCDVVILNGAGEVLLRVKDLTVRPYKVKSDEAEKKKSNLQETIYYTKEWAHTPLTAATAASAATSSVIVFGEKEELLQAAAQQGNEVVRVKAGVAYQAESRLHYTIHPGSPEDYKRLLKDLRANGIQPSQLVHAWNLEGQALAFADLSEDGAHGGKLEVELERGIYSMLHLLQAATELEAERKIKCVFAYPRILGRLVPTHEALSGFANGLTTVNHKFDMISVGLDVEGMNAEARASLLLDELANKDNVNGTEISYDKGERFVRTTRPFEDSGLPGAGVSIKKGGVYLITGGAGGLGMIFARYLAEKHGARLVLTGRSRLNNSIEAKLNELQKLGAKGVLYCRADVANLDDVKQVVQLTREAFQKIDGILHSAGVIGTIPALEASRTDFEKVLLPKIHGTLNLDIATRDESLDFMVLYSSISAVVGDFGWLSYAAGNSFLDAFAHYRERLLANGQRNGRTISVNWPLWSSGTMDIPEEEEALYLSYSGMTRMKSEAGLRAFEEVLDSDLAQLIIMSGDPQKINRILKIKKAEPKRPARTASVAASTAPSSSTLFAETENYLKKVLSEATNLPAARIDSNAELEEYGIDSIMIMELNRLLERDFESLSKTLFFEYSNLHDLTGYFVEHHADEMTELCGLNAENDAAAPTADNQDKPSRARFLDAGTRGAEAVSANAAQAEQDDIAIIGMAGRFPQAETLEQFWDNLKSGKDSITEIPRDRWDWKQYFAEGKGEKGKMYSKWGGFLNAVDKFDPLFFNISPREAELMDPQERLFLESAWESLEDAGYTRSRLSQNRVGVFVGAMFSQYHFYGVEETIKGNAFAAGSFFSSIANRVSYFMNLNGPSLAVDTACSSALEALRLACQNIWSGNCEMAIAGGVNVTLHPNKYLYLCQNNFLSTDGRCRSFGAGGDGYVPGEGVGSVLLKPLKQAIADGDQVYAVIKGVTVNHGGKTNGYTVPNPKAQASLIAEAMREADFDARTVSFIEAHGTGTALGDPIEITGLTKAFREFTPDKQFCSIGSVKSNIGHLESAAGISALVKVLLQMKHKQIAPSLHADELNPSINFADSPFYVQQELAEWKQPVLIENGEAVTYPRRAGISGFGAGGTNVHVLLEEYVSPAPAANVQPERPALVVLSAKNEDRLQANAANLLRHLKRAEGLRLLDLAYTLQTGREAMEVRLALVAEDKTAVIAQLEAWLDQREQAQGVYYGDFEQEGIPLLKDTVEEAEAAVRSGNLHKIARLWTEGSVIQWEGLYRSIKPKRVSLPTYPFAKQRYWVPIKQTGALTAASALHPLLDSNESTLEEQVYKKTLRTGEFFVQDHVVSGQLMLPGVASLEMARAAGQLAAKSEVAVLRDVVWAKPVIVEEGEKDVYIGLYPDPTFEVDYEVFSVEGGERVLHAQGKIVYDDESAPQKFEIEQLKKRGAFRRQKADLYRHFENMGFNYGPTFRVTEEVFSAEREALVRLALPPEAQNDAGQFGLHPSLMDGVLRSIVSIGLERAEQNQILRIPFSLGEMKLFKPLTATSYFVYAAISPDNVDDQADMIKYDISVLNESGEELVRLSDFTARRYVAAGREAKELLTFRPSWQLAPLSVGQAGEETLLVLGEGNGLAEELKRKAKRAILVERAAEYQAVDSQTYRLDPTNAEHYQQMVDDLRKAGLQPTRMLHLWSLDAELSDLDAGLENGVYSMMHLFKAVTAGLPELKTRCLFVFRGGDNAEAPHQEALAGFANALTTVNHRFELATFQSDAQSFDPDVLLQELEAASNGMEICRTQAGRMIRRLEPVVDLPQLHELPLKQQGAYLITGGAGGLGMIFARYLAEQYGARLVLTGRSAQSAGIDEKLRELRALGANGALYVQADVSVLEDVQRVVQETKAQFGVLNGIFHSAGIAGDQPITELDRRAFEKIVLPKVQGTINLDLATQEEEIELFVLFSSISALVGDFGAGNYAFANSFMDRFAAQREGLRAKGLRNGRSLSVNWPLWSGGGLELPEEEAALYFEYSGMRAMDAETGLQAFEAAMKSGFPQLAVACGDKQKINRVLKVSIAQEAEVEAEEETLIEEQTSSNASSSDERLYEAALNYLKGQLSQTINLPVQSINARTLLEKYGIDSIMIMELNKLLEKDFRSLPKTLFFEYKNLHDLAQYFVAKQATRLAEVCGLDQQEDKHKTAALAEISAGANETAAATETPRRSRFAGRQENRASASQQPVVVQQVAKPDEDIAIIGVSGRYPHARNVAEFWQKLQGGADCVTEIPTDRWDANAYYDATRTDEGKSYSKWGGFMEDVDKFDPLFFNISPREAELMDPQERLFLETVWHTLEDAGYAKNRLSERKVGVFVGVMYGHYQLLGVEEGLKGNHMYPSSSYASIANRVSYFFNFHGPSLALDTMCSSSLTAIHLACESLQRGDSEVAIAGGVNVSVHPNKYIQLSQMQFPSSDGRCRAFGAGGDGYVPGEGVGAVMLKPLSKALADGDIVYAVIKGSAINHGGKTNGFTVPNPVAQGTLIHDALKKANVDARTISYVEAHGTGTELGDPIEIAGLMRAYGEYTQDTQYCSIGSVKSNFGHLESAAGMASLTKVLLQMKHKTLVPSLHANPLNPNIRFEDTPFYVQRELAEWKQPTMLVNGVEKKLPRRAGISGFGAGGTNVHIILEEFEQAPTQAVQVEEPCVVVLSAKKEERLRVYAAEMAAFLKRAAQPEAKPQVKAEEDLSAQVAQEVLQAAAGVLQVSAKEIDLQEEMSEYGFDAVAFTELSAALNEKYALEIEPDIFREQATLESLAQYLYASHQGVFHAMYSAGVATEPETHSREADVSLADLAFTLQTGREPMEERIAVVASSVQELAEKLEAFAAGERNVHDLFRGSSAMDNRGRTDSLFEGEEGQEFIRKLLRNKKIAQLAHLWVTGAEIEWEQLYGPHKPKRIALPTYPFARDRYWVATPGKPVLSATAEREQTAGLHPLLDSNESTVDELCFKKSVSRDDFLVLNGEVPTSLYPEMARAAGELARRGARVGAIENLVQTGPILVPEDGLEIYVHLFPTDDDDRIEFEISASGDLYAHGTIELEKIKESAIIFRGVDDLYRELRDNGIKRDDNLTSIRESYPTAEDDILELLLRLEQGELDVDEVDHLTEEILNG